MSEGTPNSNTTTTQLSSPLVDSGTKSLSAQNHINIQVQNDDLVSIRMTQIYRAIRNSITAAQGHLREVQSRISKTDTELKDQVSKLSSSITCKAPDIKEHEGSEFGLTAAKKDTNAYARFDRSAPITEQWVITMAFDLHQDGERLITVTKSWKKEAPESIRRLNDRLTSLEDRRDEIKAFIERMQAERANSDEYRDEARADIALTSLKKMDGADDLGDLLSKYEDGAFQVPESFKTLPA